MAMVCDNGATFPASPAVGQWFYRSDLNLAYIYNGSDWSSIITLLDNGTTAGQMTFWNGTDWTYTETSEMFWDDTNKRVGIGTTTPSQALDIVGSIHLDDTTTATSGVIYKGAYTFLHNFHHPTGQTVVPLGRNTFIGINAGNLTMGSTATWSQSASNNIGIGSSALSRNTLGYMNTAIGNDSLAYNTSGGGNFALGYMSMFSNTTGSNNTALGGAALYSNLAGTFNVAMGYSTLHDSKGSYNMALGTYSGTSLTSGNSNVFIGYYAGSRQTTNSNLLIIDNQQRADTATEATNAILYGVMAALPANQTLAINANVGIGTATPAYKLDIRGSASTDLISSRIGFNFNPVTPAVAIGGYTLSAGTSLEIGNYYYIVAYVTASGTTGFASGTPLLVTTTAGNQVVNLTGIPVSTDPDVTARKIYRTKVGASNDNQYYLATINNNTATTYTDTTPDASLTGQAGQFYKVDTTTKYITKAGVQAMIIDNNLVAMGANAGGALLASGGLPATRTSLFGTNAGRYITTGAGNNIFGQAGYSLTTGSYNTIMGDLAGASAISSYGDTMLGNNAGRFITGGLYNIFIGNSSGNSLAGGGNLTVPSYGIYIGQNTKALANNETNAIVIGKGALGLGSNTIVLGNTDHTITRLFGNVGIGIDAPTAKLHIPAGTATAGTAPLKLTPGELLATPELGAVEFTDDGTNGHLYITLNVSGVLTRVQIV
ncbi:MAG: hypothetical protein WA087_01185 [Candidatus Saccharimonadales bacterium]